MQHQPGPGTPGDGVGNGEAQPGTVRGGVATLEAAGQAAEGFGRHGRAAICDAQHTVPRQRDTYRFIRRTVTQGVANEQW